jgi:outer membrane protein TolC
LSNHALDILLGQTPSNRTDNQPELTILPTLDQQTIGIPLSLLDQRPDLKAEEFRNIASNHRIGVALADLYPDLVLNGRLGTNSESLSRFFSLDNLIASVAGELATTLFQGGRLRAEVEASRARLLAQAARYSQAVITAVREVEDALISNRLLDQRLVQVTEQLTEARQAEKLAKQRYGRGIDSLLIVLETERRRQTAEDLLLRVEQLRWNSRINLHLAIGGNWLHAEPIKLSQIEP